MYRNLTIAFAILLISTAMLSSYNEAQNYVKDEGENNCKNDVIVWTAENSPYIMDTFIIEKGIKLIIEPGVTVAFKTGCGLIVKGELSAIGTEADSIIFTASPDTSVVGFRDYWCGVKFDSCESNTRLEYCVFGKYFEMEFVISCDNSSPSFSHCVFPGFVPAIETGGGIIYCIHNSLPRIEYSRLSMYGYKTACVACAEPTEFINPDSSNPSIFQNDFYIYDNGYAVVGGGFLDENYINIWTGQGPNQIDTSLGRPVDEVGDGIFTTTSGSCKNVDGITNPRTNPNYSLKIESARSPKGPKDFWLSQNYPNPFNPTTTISYSIPNPEYVTLKIYDTLGKEIQTLVTEFQQAGSYSLEWNATDLPSGIYLITLSNGTYSKTQKALLLK